MLVLKTPPELQKYKGDEKFVFTSYRSVRKETAYISDIHKYSHNS